MGQPLNDTFLHDGFVVLATKMNLCSSFIVLKVSLLRTYWDLIEIRASVFFTGIKAKHESWFRGYVPKRVKIKLTICN